MGERMRIREFFATWDECRRDLQDLTERRAFGEDVSEELDRAQEREAAARRAFMDLMLATYQDPGAQGPDRFSR
jgi:hypothetical protein